jgi:hypothetical protein
MINLIDDAHEKTKNVEEINNMIETAIEKFSFWIIIVQLTATITYFVPMPASLLMARLQKRYKSGLQFRLK